MSKVLQASCVGGIVTSENVPVPSADILSEGVASSDGILVLEEDQATYVTSNASDIKDALDKIASALSSIASALTTIDTKPPGTLPPTPLASSDIAQISAIQAQLSALKESLK